MPVFEFPSPSEVSDIPRVRVERGQFFADIITDQKSDPVMYIVILQQRGSSFVRAISQHGSMDEAQQSAEQRLQRLASRAAA